MLSPTFHRKLLDNLSTAVLMIDQRLSISYLNPAAEMLLEISGKRLKNAPIKEVFQESPNTLATFEEAAETGHPYTKREARLELHTGTEIVVDYTITPMPGGKHYPLLIELQHRDRLMRISREEELVAKRETTKILVRGLAHEIKNPLGGIRGAAQLLDRELEQAELKDYTRVIIEEADRLRNLVDQMLGPNRVSGREPVNIHEVLERVASLVTVEGGQRVDIRRDYDPSIPELNAYKEQLIQAFLNIAKNAMQAITQEEDRLQKGVITLKTRCLRQFTIGSERYSLVCKVEIIDNGPGIPEEFIENIFYPMVSGRADGTGLGLSITQNIIGQHAGLVECESKPGYTKFYVYIPLERNDE